MNMSEWSCCSFILLNSFALFLLKQTHEDVLCYFACVEDIQRENCISNIQLYLILYFNVTNLDIRFNWYYSLHFILIVKKIKFNMD